MPATSHRSTFRAPGGELAYRLESPQTGPPGSIRGRLLLYHGFSEHGGRHAPLLEHLPRRGWQLAVHDQRGHGRSPGRRGHVDDIDDYVADGRAFLVHLAREHPTDAPLALLGHSMGGLVALRHLELHPDDAAALVLTAPLLALARPITWYERAALTVLRRVAPRLPIPIASHPEWLSRDPERNRDFVDDPLTHSRASAAWFLAARRAMDRATRDEAGLRVPLLALHGDDDRITCADATRALVERLRGRGHDATLVTLHGARHELLQEIDRDTTIDAIVDWLEDRL